MAIRGLLIFLASAVLGMSQRPAALDVVLKHGVRLDDPKVELRSPDAAGSCQAEQAILQQHVPLKQTEEDRNEMIRQAMSATVQLRSAGPSLNLPAFATIQRGIGTLEPTERCPLLRSGNNRSNSSMPSLIVLDSRHPDDDKILEIGKHRGRTFLHVFKNDPGYVRWASNIPNPTGQLQTFVDYVRAKRQQSQPRRLNKTKTGPRQVPLERHVPLAFASDSGLESWTVFMVKMVGLKKTELLPEKAHCERMLHAFFRRMWWRARRLNLTNAFATVRIPRTQGSKAHVEVLFSSRPAQAHLTLMQHKDAQIIGEVSQISISASEDWREYQELMIQRCYKGLAEVAPSHEHVAFIAGGIKVYNKTVDKLYYLLVGFEVKHNFEANPMHLRKYLVQKFQSVHSMGQEGKNMSGALVRSVGGARISGKLWNGCNFNISLPYLDGQNLIDYNSRYPECRALLRNADNGTLAVRLHTKDGKKLDYPPQILEPVWRMEDLDKNAIQRLKLTAREWWDHTQAAAGQVRRVLAKAYGATTVSINLNTTVYEPSFKQAERVETRLKRGCEVKFQILPLFPMGFFSDFLKVQEQLNLAFQMLGRPSDRPSRWLDPLEYNTSSTFRKERAKISNDLEAIELKQSSHGVPIMLVFLPSKTSGEFNRRNFKNLASGLKLASQCVEKWESASPLPSRWNPAKELAISILVKVGSQWKILPKLADIGTYFIAFDVSHIDKVGRAAGYLVSSNGTIFKQDKPRPAQLTESIPDIGQLVADIIDEAVENEGGEPVRHLVISRDGRFKGNETSSIKDLASKRGLKVSMVEVTKSGPMVYRMIKFDRDGHVRGPDSGKWWKVDEHTANICTTGSPREKGAKGLSRPIIVTKVADPVDETSLEQIVEWMFSLSRLTAYSDKPTRLPIHLHLADRSAKDYNDEIEYPNRRGIHAA